MKILDVGIIVVDIKHADRDGQNLHCQGQAQQMKTRYLHAALQLGMIQCQNLQFRNTTGLSKTLCYL